MSAKGKHVVIIGGGDTGADCLGTAHRQGAASVTQLEILPRPADERPSTNPWPTWPLIYRTSSAHEEGGERVYAVSTNRLVGDDAGQVRALELVEVEMVAGRFEPVAGTERVIPAELVLLAMGFLGPQQPGLVEQLGVELDPRGNVARDARLHDVGAGGLRGRRRRSRAVADRVGDRRGAGGGRRRRLLAAGQPLDAAAPDRAHGPAGERLRDWVGEVPAQVRVSADDPP